MSERELAEELLEDWNETPEEEREDTYFAGNYVSMLAKAYLDLLDKHRWMPVSERLPEPLTKVILLFETGATRFGELGRDGEFSQWMQEKAWTLKPTHWTPLPEPLEEE